MDVDGNAVARAQSAEGAHATARVAVVPALESVGRGRPDAARLVEYARLGTGARARSRAVVRARLRRRKPAVPLRRQSPFRIDEPGIQRPARASDTDCAAARGRRTDARAADAHTAAGPWATHAGDEDARDDAARDVRQWRDPKPACVDSARSGYLAPHERAGGQRRDDEPSIPHQARRDLVPDREGIHDVA